MRAALLKAQIERTLPAAFTVFERNRNRGSIPTGIAQIDDAISGIPLHALTEICGSGKTSLLVSILAQATRHRFCALVDAGDNFDPVSGHAAGIALPRLLWVRCGKNRGPHHARFSRGGVENRDPQPARFSPDGVGSRFKLPPLEQAFKVADILLQSGGFGLIAVDLSSIPERIVRKVPLSTWFRFSRVIERQPAALVFLAQEPHAISCAALVLRVTPAIEAKNEDRNFARLRPHSPSRAEGQALRQTLIRTLTWSGANLPAPWDLHIEIVRGREKKPVASEKSNFSIHTQWA